MKATPHGIPDVILIEPAVFDDERGFFFESFNCRRFAELIRRDVAFVQDNHGHSDKNVPRGLHYQVRQFQDKLMRVVQGEVFDVAVDIPKSSLTFGHWVGEILLADNKKQLWIPEGFADGFLVLSKTADCVYKATDYYVSAYERCVAWDDIVFNISWPLGAQPTLSAKAALGLILGMAKVFK